MPKCPECKAEIDQLEAIQLSTKWFGLDETGQPVYEESHNFETETEFACSRCGKTIFYSQDEAEAFLRGDT
jgi:predicted nucleic-acid-binding Zn-ribbon protein